MAVLKSGVAKVLNAEEEIMEQLLRKFSGHDLEHGMYSSI